MPHAPSTDPKHAKEAAPDPLPVEQSQIVVKGSDKEHESIRSVVAMDRGENKPEFFAVGMDYTQLPSELDLR